MSKTEEGTYLRNMIQARFNMLSDALKLIDQGHLHRVVAILGEYVGSPNMIFTVGNGGSAATASHFVCDLGKTSLNNQPAHAKNRIRVLSLSDSNALLTAIANDVSYSEAFSFQLGMMANKGDLLIAISASGNSENICFAINKAKSLGMKTVGMFGFDGGRAKALVDEYILVDSDDYGIVEDVHMMIMHLITHYLKQSIPGS